MVTMAKGICNKCGKREKLDLAGCVCDDCSHVLDEQLAGGDSTDWMLVALGLHCGSCQNHSVREYVYRNTPYGDMKYHWATWPEPPFAFDNSAHSSNDFPYLIRMQLASPEEIAQLESNWGTWSNRSDTRFIRPATPEEAAEADARQRAGQAHRARHGAIKQAPRRDFVKATTKLAAPVLFGWLLPFYTIFVVQNLWNWFVADALHAAIISYWQALGLVMLVYLLIYRYTHQFDQDELEEYWKQTLAVLELCVPAEKLLSFQSAIKKDRERKQGLLGLLGILNRDLSEAVRGTIALGIGWLVHTLMM